MRLKLVLLATITIAMGSLMTSCTKDVNTISTPPVVVGQPVSDATPLSGSITGTMETGKTYTIGDDVTINEGDTLLLQPGVTVKVARGKTILVKGVLISLGTSNQPNYFEPDKSFTKTDTPGYDASSDSAYVGYWTGINCETTCTLLELKWTHIDYTGASFGSTVFPSGKAAGDGSFGIYFQNPDGDFIMEDSWIYGTIDDAIRVAGGRFDIMRNTFEKCGYTGGDCVNVKGGSVGDMAYNLFVGTATNATKASNKSTAGIQTSVNMYNNTYISCGYRRDDPTGRGGSLNYEEGSKGKAFNNLIVNCRTGLRVDNSPAADVANMSYGYNYTYGDSIRVMDDVYPVDPTQSITVPQNTDIPEYTELVNDTNYSAQHLYTKENGVYPNYVQPYENIAAKYVKVGDPLFVKSPLPMAKGLALSAISAVGSFDFHLQSNSPAIGKGTNDPKMIAPLNATEVSDPRFQPTKVNQPGIDMGCYQSDGTGNQH